MSFIISPFEKKVCRLFRAATVFFVLPRASFSFGRKGSFFMPDAFGKNVKAAL